MQELMPKEVAETVPPLYATEEEADPVARVKLFSCVSGWTWYVTEYDLETGEAFGFVEGFADEWGYFSIPEFEALNRSHGFNVVERDESFALAARPGNAPSGSPSPLAPLTPPVSRERLHSIACSWPRSFRRVARLGLSLRASKRSLRVAFGSPPLTIPMGWQDMHCGVQIVVPTVCPSQ